jgi:hypothetical protein
VGDSVAGFIDQLRQFQAQIEGDHALDSWILAQEFAINAATGKELWRYYYQIPKEFGVIYGPWNRGVALADNLRRHSHCYTPTPR